MSDGSAFLEVGDLVEGDLQLVLVERYPGNPVEGWVPMYRLEMRHPSGDRKLGQIDLRVGMTEALYRYGGNIGYYVDPDHRGQHYAARSIRLLLPLAAAHGLREVWITCDPSSWASRRTCELAGATLVDIVPLPDWADEYRRGRRLTCRYRIALEHSAGPDPTDDRRIQAMATLGTGEWRYEVDLSWARLPEGWTFHEVADVAVGAQDRVYVFCRGEHPMIVFDREGNVVDHWGEGVFTRAHGVTWGPDGHLYCADDGDHTVRKCTPEGNVVWTLGTPGEPAPYQGGEPFNRPTKVAFSPDGERMYVGDGYGNARVHAYSRDGDLLLSWGEYGADPGQFNLVHSVCTDRQGLVYVADRENHRIQVFDPDGAFVTQWKDLHRPCGMHIASDGEERVYVGQLPPSLPVNQDYPNLGARVSVHDLEGRRLARLGDERPGEERPTQFLAPHGIAVDSHGDIYVGEVAWSFIGRSLQPPRAPRCLRKLVRV